MSIKKDYQVVCDDSDEFEGKIKINATIDKSVNQSIKNACEIKIFKKVDPPYQFSRMVNYILKLGLRDLSERHPELKEEKDYGDKIQDFNSYPSYAELRHENIIISKGKHYCSKSCKDKNTKLQLYDCHNL